MEFKYECKRVPDTQSQIKYYLEITKNNKNLATFEVTKEYKEGELRVYMNTTKIIFMREKYDKKKKLVNLRQKIDNDTVIEIMEKSSDFIFLINNRNLLDILKMQKKKKNLEELTSDKLFCDDLDLNYLPTDNDTLKQARKEIIKNFYR